MKKTKINQLKKQARMIKLERLEELTLMPKAFIWQWIIGKIEFDEYQLEDIEKVIEDIKWSRLGQHFKEMNR